MTGIFRKIEEGEIQAGYNIIVGRTNWLNQQGIRQWHKPIPEDVIRARQQGGNFFGYWSNDELVAVVCLLDKSVLQWGYLLHGKYLCMATLASDIQYKGNNYGRECAIAACQYTKESGYDKLYLDCVDNQGRLPSFYTRLGFETLDKKIVLDGLVVVLMVKQLRDRAA